MFFNSNEKKKKLLRIDDDFATLVGITSSESNHAAADPSSRTAPGNLQFIFSYKISQLQAIEENATSVRITVKIQSNVGRHVIIKSKRAGESDPNDVIDRILSHKSKISLVNKSEQILCERISDITAKINNQLLDALRTGQADLGTLGLKKQRLTVRTVEEITENNLENSVIYPKLVRRDLDAEKGIFSNLTSDSANERELYHMMMMQGHSPASLENSNDRFISTYERSKGLLQTSKKEDHNSGDSSKLLLNFFLFDNREKRKKISEKASQEKLTVLESKVDNSILLKTKIDLKASILDLESSIVAKFELLQTKKDSSGKTVVTVIEDIERSFDPNEHVKNYFTPIKPPAVRVSKNKNVLHFSITQKDSRANNIRIYKKIINNNVYSDYYAIDEIRMSEYTGPVNYRYENDSNEFCIFRFIPVTTINKDYFPCQFTDVVIHEKKKYKNLVIIPQLTEGGIRIHAYNKDPMIQSARLLVRDIRTKKSVFSETGKSFYFSKGVTKRSEFLTGFQENNIYEFTTKIQLKNGVEVDSSHIAMIEFLPPAERALDVTFNNIANPSSTFNDVQMSINATLQTDQIGQIEQLKNLVSKNYSGDESRKAIFDKYIFFNVVRYDTSTGEESDLGIIINGENFVDSLQSAKFGASPILEDRSYKYVITPMVREPESFEESVEKKDETTRKMYKMSPKKHIHPSALKKGMLLSNHFIDGDSKHAAIYGKLGANYTFDIDNVIPSPSIEDLTARKNGNQIFLTWKIKGILSRIDHFIIMKEVDGIRKLVGKSHAIISSLTYRHELNYSDVGNTKYVLVPVYSDYSIGSSARSNDVIIEESDIKK